MRGEGFFMRRAQSYIVLERIARIHSFYSFGVKLLRSILYGICYNAAPAIVSHVDYFVSKNVCTQFSRLL